MRGAAAKLPRAAIVMLPVFRQQIADMPDFAALRHGADDCATLMRRRHARHGTTQGRWLRVISARAPLFAIYGAKAAAIFADAISASRHHHFCHFHLMPFAARCYMITRASGISFHAAVLSVAFAYAAHSLPPDTT